MRIALCRLIVGMAPVALLACGVPIDSLAIGVEDDISTTTPDPDVSSDDDADGSSISPNGLDSSVPVEEDATTPRADSAVPPSVDAGSTSDAAVPIVDAGTPFDSGARCMSEKDCLSDDDVCLDIGRVSVCVPCQLTIARRDALECHGGGKCRFDKGKLACQ